MAVHKLILDEVFDETLYSLIAIHCGVQDYRLAYLLNKQLGIKLTRKLLDIEFNANKSAYSIFTWENNRALTTWNLVSNVCKTEHDQEATFNSLFATDNKITKTAYLIPEYKKVNFFLKIEGDINFSEEQQLLNEILKTPRVITAFRVDASTLKSKDNLIFS